MVDIWLCVNHTSTSGLSSAQKSHLHASHSQRFHIYGSQHISSPLLLVRSHNHLLDSHIRRPATHNTRLAFAGLPLWPAKLWPSFNVREHANNIASLDCTLRIRGLSRMTSNRFGWFIPNQVLANELSGKQTRVRASWARVRQ